jgi:predicted O-methyltransferase YrrM
MIRLFSRFLYHRPRLDSALSVLDKSRLKLPVLNLRNYFPDFDQKKVVLTEIPIGPWSSPIADVVMLSKLALCQDPKSVLEVGSYRGFTTKLIAEHTAPSSRIVAFDRDPRHGEAYKGTELASKIERRVGNVSNEAFSQDKKGKYDFIFLDADHRYDAVKCDTTILLPLLSPNGLFIWHDYANWGRFNQLNGVPEYLHELSKVHSIVSIDGSWLAVYCPKWDVDEGRLELENALQKSNKIRPGGDEWTDGGLRG